ncbi:MAG: hypothetical protein AABY88_03010 [Pseudomonadota bacterium]
MMIRFALTAILMLSATAAFAAPDAPTETIIRLTPAQIAAIEDAKMARETASPVFVDVEVPKPPREIHGEIGFGIGTRGYSEVFGTVVTPLGDDGVAAFSFSRQTDGRRRARR